MSDYTYTDHTGDTLRIFTGLSVEDRVILIAKGEADCKEIHVANSDAPKVALELLNASAPDWSIQPVELVAIAASLERYVKSNVPEVKLQERRDALAAKFSGNSWPYSDLNTTSRNAVDAYIELEDRLAQS